MDDNSPPEAHFRSESTTVNHGSAPYGGAFFPRSRNLTVSGGTFISNNYNEPAMPPDFRRIPLGDIDLRNEIRLHKESGVIHRQHSRGSVRRMYSAKIHGHKSNMTVALYQGQTAEEEWRDYIAKYSRLCHPNFIQMFAAASRSGIHAIVVHDDLMPFKDFLKLLPDSPILTVYIYGGWNRDYHEVILYSKHMFGDYLPYIESTFWIRRSTGRLCVDLAPGDVAAPNWHSHRLSPSFDHIMPLFHEQNSEDIVIDSLELGEYHQVCCWDLGQWQTFPVSTQAELHLGAVLYSPSGSELDGLDEIAFLPDADWGFMSWDGSLDGSPAVGNTMEDGWTCYNSAEIFGTTIYSGIKLEYRDRIAWLSQANHIFHHLHIKSNYEDYALIDAIDFAIRISEPTRTPPNGYLFVCPIEDIQTRAGSDRWPDCPAYWSLNPSGAERLSMDESMHLGFPSIELETLVRTKFWDASVYAGLHKFHKGKGFDPDSQDIARHLGEPLFQILHKMEPSFAHVDEFSHGETETEGGLATTEDEDEDGFNPDVDGEVSGMETETGRKSTATTEEEGDGSAPDDECTSLDCTTDVDSVPKSWSWKIMMLVKFALILALGFGLLYEYGRTALAQRDI